MASTRDINSPDNYILEQKAHSKTRNILLYKNSPNGEAHQTMFAGDGLLAGRQANRALSKNFTDIENFLFGIGANNLVNPRPQITAELHKLSSLDIFEKPPVIIEKPAVYLENQRYLFRSSSNIDVRGQK